MGWSTAQIDHGLSSTKKFIFSLTFTNNIKLFLYNNLETTYRLYKIGNLGKTIIFKKIAKYAESLPWYNMIYTFFL